MQIQDMWTPEKILKTSGAYAIGFCQKNPGLHATVFDLADAEPIARDMIRKAGLASRIDFQMQCTCLSGVIMIRELSAGVCKGLSWD